MQKFCHIGPENGNGNKISASVDFNTPVLSKKGTKLSPYSSNIWLCISYGYYYNGLAVPGFHRNPTKSKVIRATP